MVTGAEPEISNRWGGGGGRGGCSRQGRWQGQPPTQPLLFWVSVSSLQPLASLAGSSPVLCNLNSLPTDTRDVESQAGDQWLAPRGKSPDELTWVWHQEPWGTDFETSFGCLAWGSRKRWENERKVTPRICT